MQNCAVIYISFCPPSVRLGTIESVSTSWLKNVFMAIQAGEMKRKKLQKNNLIHDANHQLVKRFPCVFRTLPQGLLKHNCASCYVTCSSNG